MFQVPEGTPEFTRIVVLCQETGKTYEASGINILPAPSWMGGGTFIIELSMHTPEFIHDIEWLMANLTNPCPRIDVLLLDGQQETTRFRHASVESLSANAGTDPVIKNSVCLIAESRLQSSGISAYDEYRMDQNVVQKLKTEKKEREKLQRMKETQRREQISSNEKKRPYLKRFRYAMEG